MSNLSIENCRFLYVKFFIRLGGGGCFCLVSEAFIGTKMSTKFDISQKMRVLKSVLNQCFGRL